MATSVFKYKKWSSHLFVYFLANQLSAFEAVCSQMLEDVQERLVYRTHIYIRAEILHYRPAQGDLAYPDKLEMMEVNIYCQIDKFPSGIIYNLCCWDT